MRRTKVCGDNEESEEAMQAARRVLSSSPGSFLTKEKLAKVRAKRSPSHPSSLLGAAPTADQWRNTPSDRRSGKRSESLKTTAAGSTNTLSTASGDGQSNRVHRFGQTSPMKDGLGHESTRRNSLLSASNLMFSDNADDLMDSTITVAGLEPALTNYLMIRASNPHHYTDQLSDTLSVSTKGSIDSALEPSENMINTFAFIQRSTSKTSISGSIAIPGQKMTLGKRGVSPDGRSSTCSRQPPPAGSFMKNRERALTVKDPTSVVSTTGVDLAVTYKEHGVPI